MKLLHRCKPCVVESIFFGVELFWLKIIVNGSDLLFLCSMFFGGVDGFMGFVLV